MNVTTSGFSLVVVGGAHNGRAIPITLPFMIGRSAECQLRPASQAISSKHCVFEELNGRVAIRDLDSRNGTFVNDDLLIRPCVLKDGDELCVGPLRFLVCSNDAIRVVDPNETIVAEQAAAGTETVVTDDRMSEDEAARLLAEDDEPAEEE